MATTSKHCSTLRCTPSRTCTLTQGYWRTLGSIPKGNNEYVWPKDIKDNDVKLGSVVYTADLVRLVGGVEPLARLVLGGWRLRQGEPVPEVPGLARFRGWDELVEEAQEARDPELRFLVQVVAQYGRALPVLVADLRRRTVAHPGMAERVLATAHKAKGLEWLRAATRDFPGLGELHAAADRDGVPTSRRRSGTRNCT